MKTLGTTIQCGASLLAILACAAFFASGWAAEPLRVRVLTYNIHHGEGTDGKIDLERTAAVIKRLAVKPGEEYAIDVTCRPQGRSQPTLVIRWQTAESHARQDARVVRMPGIAPSGDHGEGRATLAILLAVVRGQGPEMESAGWDQECLRA
jgi:hypothetical protein